MNFCQMDFNLESVNFLKTTTNISKKLFYSYKRILYHNSGGSGGIIAIIIGSGLVNLSLDPELDCLHSTQY